MTDLKRIWSIKSAAFVHHCSYKRCSRRYKRGAATSQELSEAQDKAISASVAKQTTLGLPVVTDGELRRRNFQESFGLSVARL